ncbi:Uncharacterized protein DAT39_018358 [Clarias magur]|uniref:Uncharacterized protein n=1 Tax=Clarias magur TaxID=1594786 RepID=A0A8J4TQG8_CLAMG|nr:Uncharacterized protein DAT39_018358 [Clarias magur]
MKDQGGNQSHIGLLTLIHLSLKQGSDHSSILKEILPPTTLSVAVCRPATERETRGEGLRTEFTEEDHAGEIIELKVLEIWPVTLDGWTPAKWTRCTAVDTECTDHRSY